MDIKKITSNLGTKLFAFRSVVPAIGPATPIAKPMSVAHATTISEQPKSLKLPKKPRQRADAFRDRKNWMQAAEAYREHLGAHPDDGPIWVQLGHALKESGQYRLAMTAYQNAQKVMPGDADLQLQIGHLAKMMGNNKLMFSSYLEACRLNPAQEHAYRELLDVSPKSIEGWSAIDAPRDRPAPHFTQPPAEPGIRPGSLSAFAVADPVRAAVRSVMIGTHIRSLATNTVPVEVDAAYVASKVGVLFSSYEMAADVFSAMSGIQGNRLDQPSNQRPVFGFGAVPTRHINGVDVTYEAHPILEAYRRKQIEVSSRFVMLPDRAGTVVGGPLISVLMPVYRGPAVYVERAILSVLLQTYANIELCIVDDRSERSEISALLAYYAAYDSRVKVSVHETNQGISAATNTALSLASGDYIALLDHDDMLTHDAIATVAELLKADPALDLVYSDECKIDGDDIADELFPKPDWSPSLLLSVMYTGHLSVYRKTIVERVGGFRSQFDFSQDYDLILRVAEINPKVFHLREYLYGWRMISGSASVGGKPLARLSNVAALQDAGNRRGLDGIALGMPLANRFREEKPAHASLVSLIIPSDNELHITTTIASIVLMTSYANFEIVVVTNALCAAACQRQTATLNVRYVPYDKPYNFSDKCNVGAEAAAGDYIVFFNDDVRVIESDWLDVVMESLTKPGVGVVGPKLLYENGAIQHGGMVSGVRGLVGTAFHTFPEHTPAHFGFAQCTREVALICGACLAMPAAVFREIGGYDAVNAPIAHSDVDLCFKVREAGYSCVYTPHTRLTHIGHLSIGETKKQAKAPSLKSKADIFLLRRWGHYTADDPFFPPSMREITFIDSPTHFDLTIGNRDVFRTGRDYLLISHDLSNSGAPKIVFDLAQMLREQGHYVLVVSPLDGPFKERLLELGADVMIDGLCLTPHADAFVNLACNFDAVIANTIVCWPAINRLARLTPCFWYIHETTLVGHLSRAHPELGRDAGFAHVWAGSKMAHDALEEIGIDSQVIEYGVDEAAPQTRTRKSEKIIVSVLATIEPRKGQDLAILAFTALPPKIKKQCELRFGGRVNDTGFVEGLLELDKNGDVRNLGDLTLEDYRAYLAETDILFCPSRDDTLPLVTLDALSSGKVLVCSRATGTSAYIQDAVSGFLPERNDIESLSDALRRAVEAQKDWSKIANEARSVFKRNFSIAKFRATVQRHLESVYSQS
ncbi:MULTISPECIES: glycosyltransferase [Gluconobacter]|uniref:glycosyltransferase n=1 Tax=Gluconobacter TaxID=441 RepID=UPI00117A4915|nr:MULTISPECIES: glycosyltransferase [Gluconobacter]MBS1039164.1 glycosyltransferase [Gluconobacter cerinus]